MIFCQGVFKRFLVLPKVGRKIKKEKEAIRAIKCAIFAENIGVLRGVPPAIFQKEGGAEGTDGADSGSFG